MKDKLTYMITNVWFFSGLHCLLIIIHGHRTVFYHIKSGYIIMKILKWHSNSDYPYQKQDRMKKKPKLFSSVRIINLSAIQWYFFLLHSSHALFTSTYDIVYFEKGNEQHKYKTKKIIYIKVIFTQIQGQNLNGKRNNKNSVLHF